MKSVIAAGLLVMAVSPVSAGTTARGGLLMVRAASPYSDRSSYRDANGSVFQVLGGRNWKSTGRDGNVFRFVETTRNDDYVELYDGDRKIYVRLYADRGVWSSDGSEWRRWPGSEGSWLGKKRYQDPDDTESDLRPRSAEDFYRIAMQFKAQKRWQETKENLVKAVDRDRRHLKALTELAWVLNELKEHEDAAAIALVALLVDDKSGEAWRELGYAHLKTGNYKRSVEALLLAIKLRPKDTTAYGYLATALDKMGEFELAEKTRARLRELKEEDKGLSF